MTRLDEVFLVVRKDGERVLFVAGKNARDYARHYKGSTLSRFVREGNEDHFGPELKL